MDSKNECPDALNTAQKDLNTKNTKDEQNTQIHKDSQLTQDLNMSLEMGLHPDSKTTGEENSETQLKLSDPGVESELKLSETGEESQNNNSSDLIKELSIPIELDPNFGPEKVSYDIDDLNIPIQLEDASTPTTLNSLVKKLDIPCDNEAIKYELEQSKQRSERSMLTRHSRRNEEMANGFNFRLNGLYKSHQDPKDLSTSLNFRELSKKLDVNRNSLDLSSKLLRSSKFRLSKINLEDFSKLDMNTITSANSSILSKMESGVAEKFDSNVFENIDEKTLSRLELDGITKLDVNGSGNLDINEAQDADYKRYIESTNGQMDELRALSELNYKNDMKAMGDLRELRKLMEEKETQYKDDQQYPSELISTEHGVGGSGGFQSNNELQHDEGSKAAGEVSYSNELKYVSGHKYQNEFKGRSDSKSKKKKGLKSKSGMYVPAVDTSALMNAGELPPVTVENWAQCENCKKWRRIPLSVDTEKLPETWVCSLNIWDPVYNSCSIPEEVYPEKMGDTKLQSEFNDMNTPLNSFSPNKSYSNDSENYNAYLQDGKYADNAGMKLVRERTKSGDSYKSRYSDAKNRAKERYRSVRDDKERYYESRNRTSRRSKYRYPEDTYYSDNMHTPTNTNRYYEDSRLSSRRRMHISPLVSNMSSYDDESEVIRFNVKPTRENLHPLKSRMTLYSHNLTSLLATELPHSALFLDNLRRMNMIKDDDIRDEDYGYKDGDEASRLSALALEAFRREGTPALRDKDNVFFKEDGNINLAYANRTDWDHLEGRYDYVSSKNLKFNKEDIFDNLVMFEHRERDVRADSKKRLARMYKRLSSQIPELPEIVQMSLQSAARVASEDSVNGQAADVKQEVCDNKETNNTDQTTASMDRGGCGELSSENMGVNSEEEGLMSNGVTSTNKRARNGVTATNNMAQNNINNSHNMAQNNISNSNKGGNYSKHGDGEEEDAHAEDSVSVANNHRISRGENSGSGISAEYDRVSNYRYGSADYHKDKNGDTHQSRHVTRSYGTRSSAGYGRNEAGTYGYGRNEASAYSYGRNEAGAYSYGRNGSNSQERNRYGVYGTYARNATNSYAYNKSGYTIGTRNSSANARNGVSGYEHEVSAVRGPGANEKLVGLTSHKDTESRTKIVNRDELLDVLYSFAKQYYSKSAHTNNTESTSMRSDECNASEMGESTGRTNEAENRHNFNTRNERRPEQSEREVRSVYYCKRHKYVDGIMNSIIDYKEQLLERQKQEMMEVEASIKDQSSVEEYDSAKKEGKNDVETLEGFKDYDDLLNKSQMDSEEEYTEKDDYTAERLEKELENEFKKELMEKELESKLLNKELIRNEKNKHLDYPLPNIKQLSKRCRNLESKSLRRSVQTPEPLGPKLINSYSMLFQPIPDEVAVPGGKEDMIKMLSIPIPYKHYANDSDSRESFEGSVASSSDVGTGVSVSAARVNGAATSESTANESTRSGRSLSLRGDLIGAEGGAASGGVAGGKSLTSSSVLLGGVPFASGVVAPSDLVSTGITGRTTMGTGGGHGTTGPGLVNGGRAVILGAADDFKVPDFDNLDLLSLPIPDLTNNTNTQCVN